MNRHSERVNIIFAGRICPVSGLSPLHADQEETPNGLSKYGGHSLVLLRQVASATQISETVFEFGRDGSKQAKSSHRQGLLKSHEQRLDISGRAKSSGKGLHAEIE